MTTYYNLTFPDGTLKPATDTRTVTLWADLLPEFKAHARIAVANDDSLCTLYLKAAAGRMEQWCEFPIAPKAYDWSGPNPLPTDQSLGVVLPLRNTVVDGEQFGFELLVAPKQVTWPASWPMLLEVGFASGDDMPDDLKTALFELALALYDLRSNPELQGVYAREIMAGNLSRYTVMRC